MRALALAGALAFAFTAHAFELQGHRGARGLLPENTLPSFERAIALGVTTLELDIAITSDGVLVIYHDPTLNPAITRDASGQFLERRGPPIHSLSWAQLQTYDVGRLNPRSDYTRNYPDQQPVDGTRIPRLSDLFDLVKRVGDDKIRFAIETKLRPTHPDETPAPEPFARAGGGGDPQGGHGRPLANPLVRLAHAPGRAEDRARDSDGLPDGAAALARQHRRGPRGRLGLDRGIPVSRPPLGAEDG
jgi:glycerophosphoryl diester phosphodiesterase